MFIALNGFKEEGVLKIVVPERIFTLKLLLIIESSLILSKFTGVG